VNWDAQGLMQQLGVVPEPAKAKAQAASRRKVAVPDSSKTGGPGTQTGLLFDALSFPLWTSVPCRRAIPTRLRAFSSN